CAASIPALRLRWRGQDGLFVTTRSDTGLEPDAAPGPSPRQLARMARTERLHEIGRWYAFSVRTARRLSTPGRHTQLDPGRRTSLDRQHTRPLVPATAGRPC